MGYFPFFIDIGKKPGLIVGGGRIAAHKVEKLLPFEPRLTVVAPEILPTLRENPRIVCKERDFMESDVDGMCFVIAASDDERLNARISSLCGERGILVNVADDKEKCGFLFPALVKEGALTVGISTEGASPRTAALLRSEIAAMIPCGMEEILDFLADLRVTAKKCIEDGSRRAAFLKEAALFCMEQGRILTEKEVKDRIAAASGAEETSSSTGSVTLVGAGCGSYDLITVKGLNAVRKAQVLVYDDLLDERLLTHVSESCEKIYVGKRSGKHSMIQERINELLIEKAGQGKYVVRLKGGDPFVFGRGGEEMQALAAAGIPAEEIPGITSSIAVPAAAGIPVTHRGLSRSFHVITGHTAEGRDVWAEELKNAAKLEGTCIFLMGLGRLEEIAEKLMDYGKAPDTPAAVVHGNFDGTAETVRGSLRNIADKVREAGMKTPGVIVIGGTAGMEL